MKLLRLLIALLIIILSSSSLSAGDASLQLQIDELSKRVAELEQSVHKLSGKDNWKDSGYWKKLKKDMLAMDVEKLLGKPARIEEQIFKTWYYHQTSRLHSYIWFDDGKVLGWEMPEE